jgi:hypothetical protein
MQAIVAGLTERQQIRFLIASLVSAQDDVMHARVVSLWTFLCNADRDIRLV